MGKQQFYKGNPELKQYFLVDDFSGGINDTSVDERVQTNEFRNLLNVELTKKGMIQNRKGWGQFALLNELMKIKDVKLPFFNPNAEALSVVDSFALIKIVKDEGNLLRILQDLQEKNRPLDAFLELEITYQLEILIIYEDFEGIKLGLLTLSSNTEADGFEEIVLLSAGRFNGNKPLTNIETVEYTDYIYFSLSQLQENTLGFGEYNIADKTFRFIRDEPDSENASVYYPTPFEVSKVGFNVLAESPLTAIREQKGFLSIQGLFLTEHEVVNGALIDSKKHILNIPKDGKITLNVLYTGTDVKLEDFNLDIYVMGTDLETGLPKEVPLDYSFDASKLEENIGVARFAITIRIQNNTTINLRINLSSGIEFAKVSSLVDRTFATTTAMVDFYNPPINTKFAVSSNNNFIIYNKTATPYQYELLSGITYNSVLYSPIYNDASLSSSRVWAVSTLSAYNAATARDTYRTTTYAEFDNMTVANVPIAAASRVIGFVLRVEKARFETTTTPSTTSTTYSWASVSGPSFNTSVNVGDGTSCTVFNSITASNVSNFIGNAQSYTNGHIVRVTSSVTQPSTKSWVDSNAFDYNDAIFTSDVTLTAQDTGCPIFNTLRDFNIDTWPEVGPASNYNEGHIVRVQTLYPVGVGEFASCGFKYYRVAVTTPPPTSCGTKFYQAVHTTTTIPGTTTETLVGTGEYKYFVVQSQTANFTGAVIAYNATEKKLYFREGETKTDLTSVFGTVDLLPSITQRIPNRNEIIVANTTAPIIETDYYRYNGGTSGTINDFTNITFVEAADALSYTDIYPIGVNEDIKPVSQIDTKDFRILEIGARLVLYKENIIWFSDLYQFDYIPDFNYIILPLTPDDKITSINYFKGSYMIFTRERIYKMSGTFGFPDFQIQIVNDAIGCINPYSVKPFNNTLVFMSNDGLYRIKQNYYLNGLENVEKIDKQLDNITPINQEVYGVLHNEQYMLYYKYADVDYGPAPFNVLKLYYNMEGPQGYPYVKDKNAFQPKIVATFNDELISLRNGVFYLYDIGYTDFLPETTISDEERNLFNYTTTIRTANLFFYYPTHDKKIKSIFIKTNCDYIVPLYFKVFIDNKLVYTYKDFKVVRQPDGQLTYELVETPQIYAGNIGRLTEDEMVTPPDGFDLSEDKLGDTSTQVHKIVLSGKGKGITLEVEQRISEYFGIQDIGYLYKMGKAREDR